MFDITGNNNANIIVAFSDNIEIDALGGNDWIFNYGDGNDIDAG